MKNYMLIPKELILSQGDINILDIAVLNYIHAHAVHTKTVYKGTTLEIGQLATTYVHVARRLTVCRNVLKRSIDRLESDGYVCRKMVGKKLVITANYYTYQQYECAVSVHEPSMTSTSTVHQNVPIKDTDTDTQSHLSNNGQIDGNRNTKTINHPSIEKKPPSSDSSDAIDVINHWNSTYGSKYQNRTNSPSVKLARARLSDGYTMQEIISVIDYKSKWRSDATMRVYFRPKTVLNATNFENYFTEMDQVGNQPEEIYGDDDLRSWLPKENVDRLLEMFERNERATEEIRLKSQEGKSANR